ncbi:MAG: hypothetical protein IPH89_10405 [Bacteroidetes bacterium]|nr:hypothetical protein [Bacteroidota bacterium]
MKKLSIAFFLLHLISTNVFSQNINLSNGNIFDGEPYLILQSIQAILQNIVVAWQGYVFGSGSSLTIRIKSSFNSGLTWSTAVNMPHVNSAYKSADPSLAFDANELFHTIDLGKAPILEVYLFLNPSMED